MRKVKTFRESWFHDIEKSINEWAERRNAHIITSTISQGPNGEYMAIVTYDENPEQSLLS